MIANSPAFRAAIYIGAVLAQLAAFFARPLDPDGGWAQAIQETANFLGALAGVTAMGNLSTGREPAPPSDVDDGAGSDPATPR